MPAESGANGFEGSPVHENRQRSSLLIAPAANVGSLAIEEPIKVLSSGKHCHIGTWRPLPTSQAPKALSIPAWGNAPGKGWANYQGL
jgi:hypothetical protein